MQSAAANVCNALPPEWQHSGEFVGIERHIACGRSVTVVNLRPEGTADLLRAICAAGIDVTLTLGENWIKVSAM